MPTIIVINKTNVQQPLNSVLGILNGNGAKTMEVSVADLEQSRSMLTALARAGAITWSVSANSDSADDSSEFISKTEVTTLVEDAISNNTVALPVVWSVEDENATTDNLIAVLDTLAPIDVNSESVGAVALGNSGLGSSLIDGSYSGILSGSINKIWSDHSVIPGGQNNKIGEESAADFSAICSGRNNNIYSGDTVISGGSGHIIHSGWSNVSGGRDNTIWSSANYSAITGGFGNRCEGPGSQAGGIQAYAHNTGVKAFASGQYAEAEGVIAEDYGNQQVTEVVLRGQTPGVAANEITHLKAGGFFDVPTGGLNPQDDKTYYIETKLVARKTDGTSKVFFNRTLASYAGATPTYVGANDASQAIVVGSPNALWNVVVSHNEGIDVAFNTGSGVTDKVRVVAYVKMVEVFFAEP